MKEYILFIIMSYCIIVGAISSITMCIIFEEKESSLKQFYNKIFKQLFYKRNLFGKILNIIIFLLFWVEGLMFILFADIIILLCKFLVKIYKFGDKN